MNEAQPRDPGRFTPIERAHLFGSYGTVGAMHVLGWGLLLSQASRYPALVGLGVLAYSFGLRHAFDADHISAIDNTTRKLLQNGKRSVSVGLFFSLGHSTVVFLISLALGLAVKQLVSGVVGENGRLRELGGLFGTGVSGLFLVVIGLLNLLVLLDILSVFKRMRRRELDRPTLEQILVSGGVLTRLFRKLFTFVSASWHMYPIGFLFGLGFDTASEVALLGMSAGAASQGVSLTAVMSLPLIFAAGMSLMDTSDGVFMSRAYSWAFADPVRRLFYNITVTGLSVFVALVIGAIELLQILVQTASLHAGLWDAVGNFDLGTFGYFIVGAFVIAWVTAALVFKLRRVGERWSDYLGG